MITIDVGAASRRGFLQVAGLAAAAPTAGCATGASYGQAVAQTWRPIAADEGSAPATLQRELVRYATLAPSSHNTQCWQFRLEPDRITIAPDLSRRCPIVDPDEHHLFVSLGCATETLAIAALAHGRRAHVRFDPDGHAVRIDLEAAEPIRSPAYDAIPKRQCTRGPFDGKPLAAGELRRLETAASGPGVQVLILTARPQLEHVLDYVVEANSAQLNDPAFTKELVQWIRFSDEEAVAKRDGLSTRASGNPSVPRWFAAPLFKLFLAPKSDDAKYARNIRSSAGIAIFVGDAVDKAHWFAVGRAYERFVLAATAMNVRTAMLNQPVEVAAIRPHFAAAMGIGNRRPDLVVRFGHGPEMPRSLRRPIDAVIVR